MTKLPLIHAASLLILFAVAGCAGPYRYATGSVVARTLEGARPTLVEAIDGHVDHSAPEQVAAAIGDVRTSVSEHFTRAEVVGRILPAPADALALARTLDEAARSGEHEVIFVRWLASTLIGHNIDFGFLAPVAWVPYMILQSLPLDRHAGSAAFELIVVDPHSREILARRARVASFAESVSGWGYSPVGVMQEMMRLSVDTLIDDMLVARAHDYPERVSGVDLAEAILAQRTYTIEEGTLAGPGFTVRPPANAPLVDPGQALVRFDMGGGATFAVYWDVTDSPGHYTDFARSELAKVGGEVRVHPLAPLADDLRLDVGAGEIVVWAMAQDGLGYRFECNLPDPTRHDIRDQCFQALSSARLESISRPR